MLSTSIHLAGLVQWTVPKRSARVLSLPAVAEDKASEVPEVDGGVITISRECRVFVCLWMRKEYADAMRQAGDNRTFDLSYCEKRPPTMSHSITRAARNRVEFGAASSSCKASDG